MEDELETSPPPLSPLPTDRRAGFWAWPVIVMSVCYICFQALIFPEVAAEAEAAKTASGVNPLEMKMFELQGKIIVGVAPADAAKAFEMVEQLEETITSDQAAIATALLYRFLDFDKEGENKAARVIESRRKNANADSKLLDRAFVALKFGTSTETRADWEPWIGWFSNIIPAQDGDVPNRMSIQAEGLVVAVATSLLTGGLFFVGMIGLVLLIIAFVKRSEGKFHTRFDRLKKPAGVFLEVFAIYLLLMALSDIVGVLFRENPIVIYASPLLFVVAFVGALVWPLFRGLRWHEVRNSLGLHRGAGVFREIGAGVVGYVAMLPVAATGIAITILLMYSVGLNASGMPRQDSAESVVEGASEIDSVPAAPTHPIAEWVVQGGWKMKLFVFVLAAIIAPLFEETMFRGALFRAVRSRWRFVASALIGGFIFAIIHPQGWLAAPALTAMGVGFCMIREWRDSLIAPMTAHAVNNGAIVLGLILII